MNNSNKKNSLIRLNHLNLPIQIQFVNGSSISYNYLANSVKFRKFVQNGSAVTETRYVGGFQYMNQKLLFMHLPQGYINVLEGHKPPQERLYDYVYQYKDHLEDGALKNSPVDCFSERARRRAGSLSFAYDRDRREVRTFTEHNYYPFGLEHSYLQTRRRPELVDSPTLDGIIAEPVGLESRTSQMVQVDDVRYLYRTERKKIVQWTILANGPGGALAKEWQDELGLNVTAMDFRQYDNAIGRFYGMDRLSELGYSITPYRFAYNNPVYWGDPTGLYEDSPEDITLSKTSDGRIKDYYRIGDNVFFNKNVGPDNLPLGATYVGPTNINPVTGTFWDENGKPSEMDGCELGAVTVSASRNSSSSSPRFYNHEGFGLWGYNRFGDLGGHRNGTRKHSIEASNLPTDKLNGSAKSLNIFKSAIHFIYRNIKNKFDFWSRCETINNIVNDGNISTMEVNNIETVMPPDEFVTLEWVNYKATDVLGGGRSALSTVHGGDKKDTIVLKKDASRIKSILSNDSIRAFNEAKKKNAQYGY